MSESGTLKPVKIPDQTTSLQIKAEKLENYVKSINQVADRFCDPPGSRSTSSSKERAEKVKSRSSSPGIPAFNSDTFRKMRDNTLLEKDKNDKASKKLIKAQETEAKKLAEHAAMNATALDATKGYKRANSKGSLQNEENKKFQAEDSKPPE